MCTFLSCITGSNFGSWLATASDAVSWICTSHHFYSIPLYLVNKVNLEKEILQTKSFHERKSVWIQKSLNAACKMFAVEACLISALFFLTESNQWTWKQFITVKKINQFPLVFYFHLLKSSCKLWVIELFENWITDNGQII